MFGLCFKMNNDFKRNKKAFLIRNLKMQQE